MTALTVLLQAGVVLGCLFGSSLGRRSLFESQEHSAGVGSAFHGRHLASVMICPSGFDRGNPWLPLPEKEYVEMLDGFPEAEYCGSFSLHVLSTCFNDFVADDDCCTDECRAVVEEVDRKCWDEIWNRTCAPDSSQPRLLLNALFHKCDPVRKQIFCQVLDGRSPEANQVCVEEGTCEEDSATLLTAAAAADLETVRAMLSRGADAKSVHGQFDETPLHEAVSSGCLECATLLVNAGADVDALNSIYRTPLMYASFKGLGEMVDFLIAEDANLDLWADDGRTALFDAASEGHAYIVQRLIEAGCDVNLSARGITPLYVARSNSHTEVVKLLEATGAIA